MLRVFWNHCCLQSFAKKICTWCWGFFHTLWRSSSLIMSTRHLPADSCLCNQCRFVKSFLMFSAFEERAKDHERLGEQDADAFWGQRWKRMWNPCSFIITVPVANHWRDFEHSSVTVLVRTRARCRCETRQKWHTSQRCYALVTSKLVLRCTEFRWSESCLQLWCLGNCISWLSRALRTFARTLTMDSHAGLKG